MPRLIRAQGSRDTSVTHSDRRTLKSEDLTVDPVDVPIITNADVIDPDNGRLRRCPSHGAQLEVVHATPLDVLHARCPADGATWFWSGANWMDFGGCAEC